jgi:acyl carrier protein phosphodiesterase
MNHLAHFHLAAPGDGRIVGALLADYVRGPLDGRLPAAVEEGVRLHRRIDAYTDTHAAVRALRGEFVPPARRLAGVALDLYFDLFLARHWQRFHAQELAVFGADVYQVLRAHHALFPEQGRRHAERLEQHDLLRRYAESAVVEGALARIGERLGMPGPMQAAIETARAHLPAIERGFLDFYPQLMAMTRSFSAGS